MTNSNLSGKPGLVHLVVAMKNINNAKVRNV